MTDYFGENVRIYRRQKGLTQEQLAEIIGVDKTAISVYEAGKRLPREDRMARLAEALGIEEARLFTKPPRALGVFDELTAKIEEEVSLTKGNSEYPDSIRAYMAGKREALLWCLEQVKKVRER